LFDALPAKAVPADAYIFPLQRLDATQSCALLSPTSHCCVAIRRPTEPIMSRRFLSFCWLFFAFLTWNFPVHAQSKPTGTLVPEDSPIFASFKGLGQQPGYRMSFVMQIHDSRMAQATAHGFAMGPMESVVKGGVHQSTTHMKMPAFDKPGTADGWEIRAVVKDGRGARICKSDALPRLQKLSDQVLAMQLAMTDKQAAMTVARAAAQGPYRAIQAAMTTAETVAFSAMAIREEQKAKEMWGWRCFYKLGNTENTDRSKHPLTDLHPVGDDTVNGTPVTTYQFFVRDKDPLRGPMRLSVTGSTSKIPKCPAACRCSIPTTTSPRLQSHPAWPSRRRVCLPMRSALRTVRH
jgi:hypothetical protein